MTQRIVLSPPMPSANPSPSQIHIRSETRKLAAKFALARQGKLNKIAVFMRTGMTWACLLFCTLTLAQTTEYAQPADESTNARMTEQIANTEMHFDPPGAGKALPVVELSAPALVAETLDLTIEPDDLIERLRNGFSMPNINNELVLYHQQWYLNRPDYLRRVVERSRLYLHYIVEELNKRGMPTELALLPMVESAYNPMAYSRSQASGLWQFIPSTGKTYKLEQNWWVDQRRDIIASTSAALDYLQLIYQMHGDWHLALAAYNWGEGSVKRAINKNKSKGLPTDYLSLSMPNETRNYVPKLQALKNVFSSPTLLAQIGLQSLPNRPYFSTLSQPNNIDVKIAAKLAGMPISEFLALNPAHNRPVIKSDTPLVIPTDKLETFTNNLERYQEEDKPLSSWQAYTLRSGEKIEKVAPRFGMSLANLKAVNGITGRIKVRAGQTLLVAGRDDGELDMSALDQPIQPITPRLNANNAGETASATKTPRSHLVSKGDTLKTLAKRYQLSVLELKQANRLKSEKLIVGTRLNLPEKQKPAQRTTATSAKSKKPSSSKATQKRDKRSSNKTKTKTGKKKTR
ncbi:MAG: transglycosylase SLT domain-containing protein [Pseudomonadota bacterium]